MNMFGWIAIFAMVVTAGMLIAQHFRKSSEATSSPSGWMGRLFYACMLLGLAVTAVTGIVQGIGSSHPLTGWTLIAHCAGAPLFAIGLAGVAVCWGGQNMPDIPTRVICAGWFWLMLLAGLVVILSAVLPMTPMFDAKGQRILYQTHRYASLLAMAFTVMHAGGLAAGKRVEQLPGNAAATARG